MVDYPKAKFNSLSEERRFQIILDTLKKADLYWNNLEQKESLLNQIHNYLLWLKDDQNLSDNVQKVIQLYDRIKLNLTQKTLFDFAVPIERYLNQSVKEDEFLNITHFDQKNKIRSTYPIVIVLDHLRSAFNVGSVFRSADGLGIDHLYLVGYTPTPDDQGVSKTAMGSEKIVPWTSYTDLDSVISLLKEQNYHLVALETLKESVSLTEFKAQKPLALFLGNERFGLDQLSLKKMDSIVSIEMKGTKNSLNVASAMGIFSFEVIRQWQD